MGINSGIEWTDHTWNPWYGCMRVSEGCRNCYMYYEMTRYRKRPDIIHRSRTTFRAPLSWAKKGAARVFACSWSDFFIEQADGWRDEAWEIIRQTPGLTYQILTKRPENIQTRLPRDWGAGWEHVWLGVSVENQAMAERRIPLLLKIPCKGRFLSCEPLLGEIDLEGMRWCGDWMYSYTHAMRDYQAGCARIHWVIAGGEGGRAARSCHPDWVRALRDQCIQASVPFFFKGWGEWAPLEPSQEQMFTLPVEYMQMGRKQSGCLLDGRVWQDCPTSMPVRGVNSSS